MSGFTSLNLHKSILNELAQKGYKIPTAVQQKCIPKILMGNDLLGIAQTGTGKTASFSLPIIDRLQANKQTLKKGEVRALILTPTRELATQIDINVKAYSKGLNIRSKSVIGGVRKEDQIQALENGIDVLVATPGRLMDLMRGGHISFSHLKFFVLDEADMMLDMGFLQDVEYVSEHLPKKRQTVLFSATMPKAIEELSKSILNNPIKVEVTPESSTLEKIVQSVYFVEEDSKIFLLSSLLEDDNKKSVLIFCKAKYGVANVVKHLNQAEVSVGEIHSNKNQAEREAALEQFSKGEIRVLVATDIAARGIDVSNVTHVINFNMPEDATNYVHRIGRTARAGKDGVAISLCGERDIPLLRNVQKLIKIQLPIVRKHPFHKEFELEKTKKSSSKKRRR